MSRSFMKACRKDRRSTDIEVARTHGGTVLPGSGNGHTLPQQCNYSPSHATHTHAHIYETMYLQVSTQKQTHQTVKIHSKLLAQNVRKKD